MVTAPATSKARASLGGAALSDQARRQREGDQADRHVHPQHPLPAEAVGEDAAEQDAGGAAGSGDRAPDAERFVALGPVPEDRGDDRERGGGDDRGAQSLGGAGGDQLGFGGGEARCQRGDRDQHQPGHEDAPAPQQVRGAAAEQEEAAEGEHVGVDDPGQVLVGEVERFADRRQRDVDDRGIEDDHELGRGQQDQGQPAFLLELGVAGHRGGSQSNRRPPGFRARSGRAGSRSGPARPGRASRACASRSRGGSRPSSRRGGGSRRSAWSCAPRRPA